MVMRVRTHKLKIEVALLVTVLILAAMPFLAKQSNSPLGSGYGELTGLLYDEGVDTDFDGTFDFLRVGVEVSVTDPGYFSVYVSELQDANYYYISVYSSNYTSLEAGLQVFYVDLNGPPIFLSQLNPRYVYYISLWSEGSGSSDYEYMVPLSREYSYLEFDPPTAMLTGNIYDRGVDTDGDGLFNFLEIGVEISVTKPGTFTVQVNDLEDNYGNWISVWGSQSGYFDVGLGVLNVSLNGAFIRSQGRNPRYVNYISLYSDFYSSIDQIPLSREYLYTEFDFPAVLTGVIWDQGVDTDADGLFDYLEVRVQINVSDAGRYAIGVYGLRDSSSNYFYAYDYKIANLNAGIQTQSLYLYGPQIYASHRNPRTVDYIALQLYRDPFVPYTYPYYYDSESNLPLSRQYLYTEFEAPLLDVETKFIVYPDGRVAVSGAMNYTNMLPENMPRYTMAQGYFNLTGGEQSSQASARFTANLPELFASDLFPYNSTSAALRAQYLNGIVNLGMNSSLTLPYYFSSQYPFNTTDGFVRAEYSGGILNVNVEGDTTLPQLASQQFPFNVTDITAVGSYSPHTLDGTLTFSVLDGFTFDDVNVDFNGNQTDFALNGTVSVVFGVPFNNIIIHDEAELVQTLDELKTELLGENGIVWNVTGGRLNATVVEFSYELNGIGADVTFRFSVHGDFVEALSYLLSGGKNEALLSPLVNEAYQSLVSGSFDIKYSHTTRDASVKLSLSYDVKRLLDYVLTPPTGTTPFIITSYSMSPTLWQGDIVLVEEVANAGDIVADPENGDIMAFYNPSYPDNLDYTVIHRAVDKTYSGGKWYFTTKGDYNSSPDPWSIPENLIIGKVVRRIPLLGYVISYPHFNYPYYYNPYAQTTTAARLSLLKTAVDSLGETSIQLSYSSLEKRFDLNVTQTGNLKAVIDAGYSLLPEILANEYGVPPEVKTFYESLLNTTYASMDSADISFMYGNGRIDFEATATINGDLSKEANYIKDLYFQLLGAQYSRYGMQVPWQTDFINQTSVDLNNFKVSAKLGETTFEGQLEGLILTPPKEVIDATHFTLEGLFNFTAPQNQWQREFPGEGQKLQVTIEGGSSSTHTVTLIRPQSVPEPDITAPYQKSMTWFNQTLSSLKDLIFEVKSLTEVPPTGTLTVTTTPVTGEVFVNGTSWGLAPQSRIVDVGTYNVTFGSVSGYYTPAWKLETVFTDTETTVTGVYTPITGTLSISTTPVVGEVFVNGTSWGFAPKSKVVKIGTYTVSFGNVDSFNTPTDQVVTVKENKETSVQGTYQPLEGVTATQITNPQSIDDTHPCNIDAVEHCGAHLSISHISGPAVVTVKNITMPSNVGPPPNTWMLLGSCVQITVNNTDITANARIRLYYTLEKLQAAGLDESTLKIHYWNAATSQWVAVESHVNTDEHYVWADIDHFSFWVIMGQQAASIIPTWLIIAAGGIVLIIAVIVIVAVLMRRRKPSKSTSTPSTQKT